MSYPSDPIECLPNPASKSLLIRTQSNGCCFQLSVQTDHINFHGAMLRLGWTPPNGANYVVGGIKAYPLSDAFIVNLGNGQGVRFDTNDKAFVSAMRELGWSATKHVDADLVMRLVECKGDALAIRLALQEWLR